MRKRKLGNILSMRKLVKSKIIESALLKNEISMKFYYSVVNLLQIQLNQRNVTGKKKGSYSFAIKLPRN